MQDAWNAEPCRIVCADKSAITWQYPDNGNGIVYRFG